MDRTAMKERFSACFGSEGELHFFSAPGRTEIGGNHTDHQHGKVLAAAINLDTAAAAARNGGRTIRIRSEGYPFFEVELDRLTPVEGEKGTTAALVRGVAARITQLGHDVPGFDAYITSSVLLGSGLSSSAAFEVLIGTVINGLGACGLAPVEIAQIGQYAENVFFGKPCGLMDQTASALGNLITIDFADPAAPVVKPVEVDFASFGHALCIIDSGADHADLTDEYAAIPGELKKLCACYGKEYLRELPEEEFYRGLSAARRIAGDRAVLRAVHVYNENRRVDAQVAALERRDFAQFLHLVKESGLSSWMLLQNITPAGRTEHQEIAYALTVCAKLLDGRGACRVHGGGFAGTVQAFVPDDLLDSFVAGIGHYLGEGRCHVLSIRREGGIMEA